MSTSTLTATRTVHHWVAGAERAGSGERFSGPVLEELAVRRHGFPQNV